MILCSVVGFQARTVRGADEPASVAVLSIGDSNFNYVGETFWGSEWPAAISGSRLFSGHIDADSGRSINRAGSRTSGLDAVAANADAIADSGIVLVTLGVNDHELGEEWRDAARSMIAAIRSRNASVEIHWITPVAQVGVADAYLVERAVDHATTLRELRAAGEIDGLVEWDLYATANPEVFHSDGIHFWLGSGGRALAEFTAAALLPGGTPGTTPVRVPPTTAVGGGSTPPPADLVVHLGYPRCGSDTLPWAASDDPLADTINRAYLTLAGRNPSLGEQHSAIDLIVSTGRTEVLTEALLATGGLSLEGPAEVVVDRLYRQVLRRPADSAGLRAWSAALRGGTPPQQLAHLLAHSPEAVSLTATSAAQTSRQGMVCRLYLAGLGRAPDAEGLAFWSGQHTLAWVTDAIADSDEFTGRFPVNAGDGPVVEAVYRHVLGRAPDPGGMNYWKGRLTGGLSRGSFVLLVSNSPEFIVRTATVP